MLGCWISLKSVDFVMANSSVSFGLVWNFEVSCYALECRYEKNIFSRVTLVPVQMPLGPTTSYSSGSSTECFKSSVGSFPSYRLEFEHLPSLCEFWQLCSASVPWQLFIAWPHGFFSLHMNFLVFSQNLKGTPMQISSAIPRNTSLILKLFQANISNFFPKLQSLYF